MLFTGWEVRIGKNCDRGLNMLTEASGSINFIIFSSAVTVTNTEL